MSDERGDIGELTSGFFAHDTRFLSRLVLSVQGSPLLLLSSGRVEHFAAAFFLRNASLERASAGRALDLPGALRRHGHAGADRDPEREHAPARLRGLARARRGLRGHHLGQAPRLRARRSRERAGPPAVRTFDLRRGTRPDPDRRIRRATSEPASSSRSTVGSTKAERPSISRSIPTSAGISLVDVVPSLDSETDTELAEHLSDERETLGDVVAAWTLRVPRVRGGWESLRRAFDRSIADLAALRMRTGEFRRPLFAAGMPWFMTVFGRDTAITSLQSLLLGPEPAIGALDALAELQATTRRPGDRRGAGEDRPRSPPRSRRRVLVPALLRLHRLHAALSRPSRRDLALDGRRRARPAAAGAGHARARVDRPLRRPRRGRLRRVRAAGGRRPDEPVLEGLRRLAALPRRALRRRADRPRRGAGLRVRREARAGRDRARRLARAASSPSGSSARPPSSGRRSTRRSGSRSAAASSRSRWTGRRSTSTPAARTWGTCSGAGSSCPSASRRRRRPAPLRVALVGLGDSHDGERRGRVQPDQLPQRNGLASRHVAHRLGARTARLPRGGEARRARADRGRGPLRLVAARGLRRATRATRRRSRSRTRPPPARRRGPPARRSCSCACCSGSSRTASVSGS